MLVIDNESEEPLLIASNFIKKSIEDSGILLSLSADYEWSKIGTAWEWIPKKGNNLVNIGGTR